jgi:hypothetical protein
MCRKLEARDEGRKEAALNTVTSLSLVSWRQAIAGEEETMASRTRTFHDITARFLPQLAMTTQT